MRILVDGLNLARPTGTGIATYTRNFITQAAACGHEIDIMLGHDRPSLTEHEATPLDSILTAGPVAKRSLRSVRRFYGAVKTSVRPCVRSIPISSEGRSLPVRHAWQVQELYANAVAAFRRFGRFVELDIPGIDVAHWTSPIPVRLRNAKNIYTIHDMVPVRRPDLVLGNPKHSENLCKKIAETGDLILTVSECSKSDIVDILDVSPDKVVNTYQSLEEGFWQERLGNDDSLPGEMKRRGYFLFFGAVEPKKNILRILRAHQAAQTGLPLVLVASPGWASDDVWKEIHAYCKAPGQPCLLLTYLPRQELMALVANARAVVFPAVYEGFGLPALEAMALGTSVIGSTTGSLPEVIGQAGVLVDPNSIDELAEAMRLLAADSELAERLSASGKKQAALFSPVEYRTNMSRALARLVP